MSADGRRLEKGESCRVERLVQLLWEGPGLLVLTFRAFARQSVCANVVARMHLKRMFGKNN